LTGFFHKRKYSAMRKMQPVSATPLTLSDADKISSRVTRRSLLSALGLGAGVAAAATLGATDSAPAADPDSKTKKKSAKKPAPKPKEESDSD
jgi:hypothetical protein